MDLSSSSRVVLLFSDIAIYPFCLSGTRKGTIQLLFLSKRCAKIYKGGIYQNPSILGDRQEMPDHVTAGISTRSSSREVHFYKAIDSTIRFLKRAYHIDGFPGQVPLWLAKLVNELLDIGRRWHIFIKQV